VRLTPCKRDYSFHTFESWVSSSAPMKSQHYHKNKRKNNFQNKAKRKVPAMPRGYLKKDNDVGAKGRRGGNSRKLQKKEHPKRNQRKKPAASTSLGYLYRDDDWSYDYIQDRLGIMSEEDGYWLPEPKKPEKEKEQSPKEIGECGICYDTKPLMQLSKSCHHAKACYKCFRQYYIVTAQKDIANYPLRCWHPACSFRKLHVDQAKQFASNSRELKQHYRLSTMARAKEQGKMVANCPNCDHPRAFSKNRSRLRVFSCQECKKSVEVMFDEEDRNLHNLLFGAGRNVLDELREITQAVESLEADSFGNNQGWALCPRCHTIISKGYGCDHMNCTLCGSRFNWSEAKETVRRIRQAAKCLVTEPAYIPSRGLP
jgi:hypothetical protein